MVRLRCIPTCFDPCFVEIVLYVLVTVILSQNGITFSALGPLMSA